MPFFKVVNPIHLQGRSLCPGDVIEIPDDVAAGHEFWLTPRPPPPPPRRLKPSRGVDYVTLVALRHHGRDYAPGAVVFRSDTADAEEDLLGLLTLGRVEEVPAGSIKAPEEPVYTGPGLFVVSARGGICPYGGSSIAPRGTVMLGDPGPGAERISDETLREIFRFAEPASAPVGKPPRPELGRGKKTKARR